MLVVPFGPPTCANAWEFMLFRVRATTHHRYKLQLLYGAATRKPFELLRVGTELRSWLGHQKVTNIPSGIANIAKTLLIHCVSGHAPATDGNDPRSVTLPPPPNTAKTCAFAWLAGIGTPHGAMLATPTDQCFCANAWKFMLFRVVDTQCVEPKMQHHSSTAWQKTFEFSRQALHDRLGQKGISKSANMRIRLRNRGNSCISWKSKSTLRVDLLLALKQVGNRDIPGSPKRTLCSF